jgi:hypothetical protein
MNNIKIIFNKLLYFNKNISKSIKFNIKYINKLNKLNKFEINKKKY